MSLPPPVPKPKPDPQGVSTWTADVATSLRTSRRLAEIIAASALIVALAEAIALVRLFPLKTVIHYTIYVDHQTGYVETAEGTAPQLVNKASRDVQSPATISVVPTPTNSPDIGVGPVLTDGLSPSTAAIESYLARYVVVRESQGERQASSGNEVGRTDPGNLRSPTLGATLDVLVTCISLLTPSSARVRFETTRRAAGARTGAVLQYVADVEFRYEPLENQMSDVANHSGYLQVKSYRRKMQAFPGTAFATHALPAQ